jgi:AraC-like DNA-binding protein
LVESRHDPDRTPVPIGYSPQDQHHVLPVEVLLRSSVLARRDQRGINDRQRVGFHLLMVCFEGYGSHAVDFEPVELSPGTCLRIHPGQVQRFAPDAVFDAHMVVWPDDAAPADPVAPAWYPGSGAATSWHLEGEPFTQVLHSIDDLRAEQERFDGSPQMIALLRSLLRTLVLRLAVHAPAPLPETSALPELYVGLRQLIEQRLTVRPTVVELAHELGYSLRTLDRACRDATGQTAKQVLDERTTLEIRRLLTHTDRALVNIAADFSFQDPSNFTKFVRRHLGEPPSVIRDRG